MTGPNRESISKGANILFRAKLYENDVSRFRLLPDGLIANRMPRKSIRRQFEGNGLLRPDLKNGEFAIQAALRRVNRESSFLTKIGQLGVRDLCGSGESESRNVVF